MLGEPRSQFTPSWIVVGRKIKIHQVSFHVPAVGPSVAPPAKA